jgi:hypothetical protein
LNEAAGLVDKPHQTQGAGALSPSTSPEKEPARRHERRRRVAIGAQQNQRAGQAVSEREAKVLSPARTCRRVFISMKKYSPLSQSKMNSTVPAFT